MIDLDRLRTQRVQTLGDIAAVLDSQRSQVLEILSACEPAVTALDEFEKSIRALATYADELPALADRSPFGRVAVALPFNNPLYSLVVYAAGAAVGGSPVIVRPSAHSRAAVQAVYDLARDAWLAAEIELTHEPGAEFIARMGTDESIASVIFTGAYSNMLDVSPTIPQSRRFVYCGSGINPFVVGPMEGVQDLDRSIDLVVRSRTHNSGQDCLCTERVHVHESVIEEFSNRLVERVSSLTVGAFGSDADITPLIGPIAERSREILTRLDGVGRALYRSPVEGQTVGPQVFLLNQDDPDLNAEKFAPIFTLAPYATDDDLTHALESDYRLGLTFAGAVPAHVTEAYPHVSSDQTVIETEAEDAHVAFGGYAKSGHSRRGPEYRDGPLLFSLETTEPLN